MRRSSDYLNIVYSNNDLRVRSDKLHAVAPPFSKEDTVQHKGEILSYIFLISIQELFPCIIPQSVLHSKNSLTCYLRHQSLKEKQRKFLAPKITIQPHQTRVQSLFSFPKPSPALPITFPPQQPSTLSKHKTPSLRTKHIHSPHLNSTNHRGKFTDKNLQQLFQHVNLPPKQRRCQSPCPAISAPQTPEYHRDSPCRRGQITKRRIPPPSGTISASREFKRARPESKAFLPERSDASEWGVRDENISSDL